MQNLLTSLWLVKDPTAVYIMSVFGKCYFAQQAGVIYLLYIVLSVKMINCKIFVCFIGHREAKSQSFSPQKDIHTFSRFVMMTYDTNKS